MISAARSGVMRASLLSKCLATSAWSWDAVARALRAIAVLMPPGCTQVTRPGAGQDHLLAQRLGEAADPELRGVVGGLARHADQPEQARDVHDVAVAGLDQVGQELLGAVHDAPEVDVHDPLEVLVADLLEVAVQGDAGVVDDHVDPAELWRTVAA